MNGKDIFLGLKYVGDDLIEKAEYGQFPTKAEKAVKMHRGLRRPLVLAAAIGLMMLLVGCAVVYVLSMDQVKIGETTETVDYRLVEGTYVEDPHEVSENVLTLAGLKGTKAYQACADYYVFKEEYDRNFEEMEKNGTLPEDYYENGTYTKDLKSKADELAEQYGLQPEGNVLDFRTTRNMCDALGVERFLKESEQISADVVWGSCYDSGNFNLNFRFEFPEDQGYELLRTSGYLFWNRTDCFSRDYVTIVDSGDWIERNYTTSSGSEVLILQSPSQERGYIICDRGNALMSLQLDINIEYLSEDNGVVSAEYQHLTNRQIELIADIIDFAIQPRVPTQADVDAQAGISQAVTQNGWTVNLKSVETDGYVIRVTVGITAPEGTAIPTEGNIIFANHGGEMVPVNREETGGGGTIETLDDSDGLDNTVDLLLIQDCTMADGTAPYGLGTMWDMHIVDIVHSWWDDANRNMVRDTLTEGEWLFPIIFDESNGDYREMELLSQPITAKGGVGWYEDGTDALEELEVTSVKLRRFSIDLVCENEIAEFFQLTGKTACAVMKDGTKVEITNKRFEKPIDLDQVDHVLLADGTKLMVPEA